jgi:high-affinity nickel-transport protein
VHSHIHRHLGSLPDDPFTEYASGTAFGVGMISGVGAETPTQVLIFLTAAGMGGKATGLLILGCFLVGLLISNTAVALAGAIGFLGASRHFGIYAAVSLVTAFFSLVVGTIFLVGGATILPALFGG